MKTILGILFVGLIAFSTCAQTNNAAGKKTHHKKNTNTNETAAASAPGQPAPDPVADQAKMLEQYQKLFVPTDPWRVMNDKTNYAKGADWVQFEGRVTAASSEGLVLQGWFGAPLAYMSSGKESGLTTGSFFLSGYPRGAAVGQLLSRNDRLVAMKSGTKGDLVNLDYGSVWAPEVTEEQKTAASDAKAKTAAKVLAWQKEQADNGDAYGEYKMGLRYLNGDGVDKSVEKARDMFTKSAAQGNTDASNELAKLPAN